MYPPQLLRCIVMTAIIHLTNKIIEIYHLRSDTTEKVEWRTPKAYSYTKALNKLAKMVRNIFIGFGKIIKSLYQLCKYLIKKTKKPDFSA
jgi:hypothetical protein